MSNTKKYRLLKDLPDSKPGDIYICDGRSNAYFKNGDPNESYWLAIHVENNSDWWEEVKEPERIEVEAVIFSPTLPSWDRLGWEWYSFATKKTIKQQSFPLIRSAIENVLNEPDLPPLAKLYTKQDLEDAFDAGRAKVCITDPMSNIYWLYKTFQDYLNSLNKQ